MAEQGTESGTDCTWLSRVQDVLDDRLPPAELEEFQEHSKTCKNCREELAALRTLQGQLRSAAAVPPPALDQGAIAHRIFERSSPQPLHWLVPAAAGLSAVALVVVALMIWPVDSPREQVRPKPSLPDRVEAVVATPAPAVPQVTYLAGQVDGIERLGAGNVLALERKLHVRENSRLTIRLDPHSSLALLEESQARVSWRDGWDVHLDKGSLAARLDKERKHPFRVHVPAGVIEATGTRFSVAQTAGGVVSIVLAEGSLALRTGDGRDFRMKAPAVAEFSAAGLGQSRQIDQKDWAVLVDGFKPLETRLAMFPDRLAERRVKLAPKPVAKPDLVQPALKSDLLADARRALAAHEYTNAQRLLFEHLELKPDDPRGLLLLADTRRLTGRPLEALDLYLKTSALTGKDHPAEAALFQAGLLRLNALDKPDEALATFEVLRRDHARDLVRQEVAFHLAECYLGTRDFTRALRALRDYLRLYPEGTKSAEARSLLRALEEKGWK